MDLSCLHRSEPCRSRQGDSTQARQFALKAHPGKITDEELGREAGGSGLRYSFDIRTGSRTQEVGIDAATGKVLENKTEGPHPD
ncbi:PepSY domain-containing protein [Nitrobacter sp. 62-23]|uniref:PepSY domain-containing protein n=1 Tax=unclassified Nitrobacter TaxID=2620411 RepID=UPI001910349C|nr:PepSY domain-containing protein [Nitrobacter sp.]